ncbi:MAG: hypothetical protein EKK61_00085 [Rickettsiales bacterium]|nr:MAG: hypothetical protein EKK61_00085 [Rickettsiales bacterium]
MSKDEVIELLNSYTVGEKLYFIINIEQVLDVFKYKVSHGNLYSVILEKSGNDNNLGIKLIIKNNNKYYTIDNLSTVSRSESEIESLYSSLKLKYEKLNNEMKEISSSLQYKVV